MQSSIDRDGGRPVYAQIASDLRTRLQSGELAGGDRLPTSRALAERLGVSRASVVRAYRELAHEGWVEGRVGSGTVVRRRPRVDPVRTIDWDLRATARTPPREAEFAELLRSLGRSDLVSFAGGLPPADLYPIEAVRREMSAALEGEFADLLHWCPVEGYPPLRDLLGRSAGRSADETLVVAGSTQGLHLLALTLLEPGDAVVVEDPTYVGALRALRAAGARLIPVPREPSALDLAALESALEAMRPKLVYVVPTFHNPTSGTLPLAQRRGLLELAARHRVPVVEDDPYSALRYDGSAVPSLAALDGGGIVVHLSTFSKVLLPGLRVGWLAGPPELIRHLSAARSRVDLFGNGPAQACVHGLCASGELDRHLERILPIYRERRDAMVSALRRHCPGVQFRVPEGGFFVWAELPEDVEGRRLLEAAVRRGVAFVHGDLFSAADGGSRFIRLCFVGHPPEAIRAGIQTLGEALRRAVSARGARREAMPAGPIV